ncbi:unnamed protein product [Candidula unifasciata]|uniref:Mitochondrial fission process protein 1 n=1 Tax=Candidula unifasciata TaxID=100452 RepID=A0A8S3YH49_9EUPU|nr:unnamed protein product [Candidula unifasciata]
MADPFTVAPLRILGYGYATGVALRFRFCQDLKDACFVVATTFIVCHATYRSLSNEGPVYISVLDTLVFEGLASAAIPPLTTYFICSTTRNWLKQKDGVPKPVYKWLPVTLGLSVLPFLYSTLDICVNKFLDQTLRPLYMP